MYPRMWTPGTGRSTSEFSLDGELADDCKELRLTDSTGSAWRLRHVARGLWKGTRSIAAGFESVSLHVVPATDSGARGPWSTFSSPRWPITFQYPASWRLAEERDSVILECPDAYRLAWGGRPIWLTFGAGREQVEAQDGQRGTRIDRFINFGDEWLIGFDICERAASERFDGDCQVARESFSRGMTVLQGSVGEDRLYRIDIGYLGQGAGIMSYLFM